MKKLSQIDKNLERFSKNFSSEHEFFKRELSIFLVREGLVEDDTKTLYLIKPVTEPHPVHLMKIDAEKSGMALRMGGEYVEKGIYLTDTFDWKIVKDKERMNVLLRYEKGKAPVVFDDCGEH